MGGRVHVVAATNRPWFKGKLREDLLNMPRGAEVWIRKPQAEFVMGPTWWIMSDTQLARVTQTYGGLNLKNIVTPYVRQGVQISTRNDVKNHTALNARAKRLLGKRVSAAKRKSVK